MPASSLKKRNSIPYHCVGEAAAADKLRKVHKKENLTDLLAKPLGASGLKALVKKSNGNRLISHNNIRRLSSLLSLLLNRPVSQTYNAIMLEMAMKNHNWLV
jgi:hypothetical protein